MMYAHGVSYDEDLHRISLTWLNSQAYEGYGGDCGAIATESNDFRAKVGHADSLSGFYANALVATNAVSETTMQREEILDDQGRFQSELDDAIGGVTLLCSHNCTNLSKLLSYIGWVCFSMRKKSKALEYALQAALLYKGQDKFFVASVWCNVGFLLYLLDHDINETINALTRSFQVLSSIRSADDRQQPKIATVQALLLLAHARRDGIDDHNVIALLENLIELRERFGCDCPTAAGTLRSLGAFYMKRGLNQPAKSFLLEAVRIDRKATPDSTELLLSLMHLGQCHEAAGDVHEALSCYKEALHLKKNSIWGEPVEFRGIASSILYSMGAIHSTLSRNQSHAFTDRAHQRESALQCFHACLDLRKSCYGEHHPSIGNVLHNIAILLMEDGDVSSAIFHFETSLRVWSTNAKVYQGGAASSLRYMAYIYKEQGDFHQALQCFAEALGTLRHAPCTHDDLLIEVLVGQGLTQRIVGLIDQAFKSYEEAAQLLRERTQLGNRDAVRHMVRLLTAMGNLAMELSDTEAARAFFTEAASLDPNKEDLQVKSCQKLVELSANLFPRHSAAA